MHNPRSLAPSFAPACALLVACAVPLLACATKAPDASAPAWTLSSAGTKPLSLKSTKVTEKHDPAWASCHQSFKPKGVSVEADVSAMAKGCEGITKMKLVGDTLVSTAEAAQKHRQRFPLSAEAGKCYRVYASSAATVGDLDVVLKDSAGGIVGEDATDDPSPVLLEDGALCFTEADAARLVVTIGVGTGSYAMQIWSD
jgi:hypothetical protein